MVPKGWIEVPLGALVERVVRPVAVEPERLYQEIGIRSHGKGLFDKPPIPGSALGTKRVFWVQPNCLAVNIVFAWEQAVARTTQADVGKIASHRFPMYRPRSGKADLEYLTYLFKTPYGKHLLSLASPGGAGRNKTLGQTDFLKTIIRVPPFRDQQDIAAVLRLWDKAIATADKFSQTTEVYKVGLRQTLLGASEPTTDQKEFPWRTTLLHEVAEIRISNVDKKSISGEAPVLLCNYTDVYHNTYITSEISFMNATATSNQIEKFSLRKDDVIITKDSESPEDIAISAVVDEDLPGVLCGYHLALLRPKRGKISGDFLSNILSLNSTRHYFLTRANGATRFGLTIDAIRNATLRISPFEEQLRIAKVLREAERAVHNSREQVLCLREQKKALMQQLLTGKRRVCIDTDAPREVLSA